MKKEKNVLLLLTLSSKKCSCCGEVKPTTEFTRLNRHGIGLGKFMDNTDYLLSAISYLKKNK